jgi:hypothetical protein
MAFALSLSSALSVDFVGRGYVVAAQAGAR